MDILPTLMTGGLLAGAGTVVYQLKSLPIMLFRRIKRNYVYTTKIYQYDELFDMLETWLANKHQKQYKDVEAVVEDMAWRSSTAIPNTWQSTGKGSKKYIRYKQEENTFILKYAGRRIIITKTKEKTDKAVALKDMFFRKYSITGWRCKEVVDKLLNEVMEFSKMNEQKNSVKIFCNNSYGDWESNQVIKIKPIASTIINESKKEAIIQDVDDFLKAEDWYTNVSVPYKRGYCFYGPPGTGKTTIALALANYTKRNVYCINLNSITDDARLPKCISEIKDNSILLIEDIDKVFSGRDNVNKEAKITFSSLLNCLDGAFYRHGLITIITTNHIEKLDEALIRTGRIDFKMEIPKPSDVEISSYLSLFYNEDMRVKGHFDLKMSDVQGICLQYKDCPELAKKEIINKIIN